jgi:hypothetical protein
MPKLSKQACRAIAAHIASGGAITYCATRGRKTKTRKPSAAQRRAIVKTYLGRANTAPDAPVKIIKPTPELRIARRDILAALYDAFIGA